MKSMEEVGVSVLACILSLVMRSPDAVRIWVLACKKFHEAAMEVGTESIMATWLSVFDVDRLRSHECAPKISTPQPQRLCGGSEAFYWAPTIGSLPMGSDMYGAFEVEILKLGSPSTSIGVASSSLPLGHYKIIKDSTVGGGAWTYNSYCGAKFHHDEAVSGRHYSKGKKFSEASKVQVLIYTGTKQYSGPAKGARVTFFVDMVAQQGAMAIHCTDSLVGAVDCGAHGEVTLHAVDQGRLEELMMLAKGVEAELDEADDFFSLPETCLDY
eukprot:TRINITY_DN9267_c0_g1_i3.p1 TRINITY_DN9267_c0_g1~~TRINITY_DN9267_c0_g1_i3.p1  ORF type:complete len:270 (+),score=57.73 TRINITY_DN9267_c0_g1_i3:3-812(+)